MAKLSSFLAFGPELYGFGFGFIYNARTRDWKDRDAFLAWKHLCDRYVTQGIADIIQLSNSHIGEHMATDGLRKHLASEHLCWALQCVSEVLKIPNAFFCHSILEVHIDTAVSHFLIL